MPGAYYNEIEPFAAQWLRNLIAEGLIAPGDVDERSILDVRPDDLRGYVQCHFFAGIGGWSHALRLAGWPDDRPVWTGSCPCQPFSAAGKGAGFADERHLWPVFHRLIDECRPGVVFGEQVASKDGLEWLDLVQADLEASGYASAAVDICAAGVGAPHIRQRLWWVADAVQPGRPEWGAVSGGGQAAGGCGTGVGQADTSSAGLERRDQGSVGNQCSPAERGGGVVGLGISDSRGRQAGHPATQAARHGRAAVAASRGDRGGPTNGFWRDADWLLCRDGKWRPVEPRTFPLAHGIPGRVGQLRAYGNAIVPSVAAEVIGAYLDVIGGGNG